MSKNIPEDKMKIIEKMQQSEITEHYIYQNLAKICKNRYNKKILEQIAEDEKKHYEIRKSVTEKDFQPIKWKIVIYTWLAKIFGLAFTLKFMEAGESEAQNVYDELAQYWPQAGDIKKDEIEHEKYLINLLNDEKLKYAGAIVLGLNDALVELTGTLAGLSFAFSQSKVIGVTGIIMGIAAALSMASSGYLSAREEENEGIDPVKSAIYTGIAYILTVVILVLPYFIFDNPKYSLVLMLIFTLLIIAGYNFYISVAKEDSFKKRFTEMALISLGVAVISFAIGYVTKILFGIDV